jgi:hypothetical protein
MKFYIKIIILLAVVSSSSIYCQKIESNLKLFLNIAEKIANEHEITYGQQVTPDSSILKKYPLFYNYWNNRKPKSEDLTKIQIKIDSVKTEYTDLYRDGLFGDYKLVRKISIFYSNPQPKSNSIIDTLTLDNFSSIENPAFPFTKSELPPEPFWQSLIEPLVYLGATISVVILLFTTRS